MVTSETAKASSPFLIQTLAHDVYGFYPDLIIFHDFGDQQFYEKIIAGIRSHTTAEILDGDSTAFDRTILLALRNPANLSDPLGPPSVLY